MNAPDEQQFEWTPFSHGFVFWEIPTAEHRPPGLDNAEGLREWLAGFQQAYTDYPNTLDPDDGESLSAALDRLLTGVFIESAKFLAVGRNSGGISAAFSPF